MSVAGDIADAVEAAVTGLALTFGGTGATVSRRKVLALPPGKDPPQVVVWVEAEPETEYLDAESNLNRYPAAVALVTAGGRKLADDEEVRAARQSVRREVDDLERATFAAVSGFNRTTAGGRNPFAGQALAKDLNVSVYVFTVEVIEPRAT